MNSARIGHIWIQSFALHRSMPGRLFWCRHGCESFANKRTNTPVRWRWTHKERSVCFISRRYLTSRLSDTTFRLRNHSFIYSLGRAELQAWRQARLPHHRERGDAPSPTIGTLRQRQESELRGGRQHGLHKVKAMRHLAAAANQMDRTKRAVRVPSAF